jgi:tellurite resistance protein TerC
LRSMYFALSDMMGTFEYLHYGLALILIFFGSMMLGSHYYQIRTEWTLLAVAGILIISMLASAVRRKS